MNTREENVVAATREAEETERKQQLRRADLEWARRWREGNGQCPCCAGTEFDLVDDESGGQMRYEIFKCLAETCEARWKLELREEALVVLRNDMGSDDDWIELRAFDSPQRVDLSERESATILAALRFWRRERLANSGHERDIETAFDHLEPLSDEEIGTLCEHIAGLEHGHSGASKT